MTVALIDTDILIYEAASICERSIPWPFGDMGEFLWTRTANMDEAWVRLNDSIAVLQDKVKADSVILPITCSTNWRTGVYADYKSNRKPTLKPMLVPVLRDRIALDPRGRRFPGLEGDDILGILATKPRAGDVIMVTIDKDLRTIPGRHFNFRTEEFFEVTEGEANQFHLQQALMGDATDGYPGCPGIGPKKVEKLIPEPVAPEDIKAVWDDIIVPTYEKAGLGDEFALSQARCARILRACDYDPKTKEVIHWRPY